MEQLMQSIPGVIDAESGYANGTCETDVDYKSVCKGETGFRETVRVEYDPGQVSLDALLLAYSMSSTPRCKTGRATTAAASTRPNTRPKPPRIATAIKISIFRPP